MATITTTQDKLLTKTSNLETNLANHKNDKNNPHAVTKSQVGLGNVDNTSDVSKPISNATKDALNKKQDKSISVSGITATTVEGALTEIKNLADAGGSGVSDLQNSKQDKNITFNSQSTTVEAAIKLAYDKAISRNKGYTFNDLTAMTTDLKNASKDKYIVGDNLYIKAVGTPDYWVSGILSTNTGTYGYYEITELEGKIDLTPYQTKNDTGLATSNKTVVGAINENRSNLSSHTSNNSNPHSVTKAQVGLGNVDNTSDKNKPVSTATQNALNLKQPKTLEDTGISISHDGTIVPLTTVEDAIRQLATYVGNYVQDLNHWTPIEVNCANGVNISNFSLTDDLLTIIYNAIKNINDYERDLYINFDDGTMVLRLDHRNPRTESDKCILYTGHCEKNNVIYKVYLLLKDTGSTLTQTAVRIEEYATVS